MPPPGLLLLGVALAFSPEGVNAQEGLLAPATVVVVRGQLMSGNALGTLPAQTVPVVLTAGGGGGPVQLGFPQARMSVLAVATPTGATITVDGLLDFTPVFGGDWIELSAVAEVYVQGCRMPFEISGQAGGTVGVSHPQGCSGTFGPHGLASFGNTSVGSSSSCADGSVNISESPIGLSGLSASAVTCFPDFPGVAYSRAASFPIGARVFQSTSFNPFGGSRRIVSSVTASFTVSASGACTRPKAVVANLISVGDGAPESFAIAEDAARSLEEKGWDVSRLSIRSGPDLCAAVQDACVRGIAIVAHGIDVPCSQSAIEIAGAPDGESAYRAADLQACLASTPHPMQFIQMLACYTDLERWRIAAGADQAIGANIQYPRLFPFGLGGNCNGGVPYIFEAYGNLGRRFFGRPAYDLPGPCGAETCLPSLQDAKSQILTSALPIPQCLSFRVCDLERRCGDAAFPPASCSRHAGVWSAPNAVLTPGDDHYSCDIYWTHAVGESAIVIASAFDRIPGRLAADTLSLIGKAIWISGSATNVLPPDSIRVRLAYEETGLQPGMEGSMLIYAAIEGEQGPEMIPFVQNQITNTVEFTLRSWGLAGIFVPESAVLTAPSTTPRATAKLGAPEPNPAGGVAMRIPFSLPRDSEVQLTVHDVAGRLVAVLASGLFSAGPHEVRWRGIESTGAAARPGTYFVRLGAEGQIMARRLILLQ